MKAAPMVLQTITLALLSDFQVMLNLVSVRIRKTRLVKLSILNLEKPWCDPP